MLHQLQSLDRLFLDLDSEKTSMAVTPLYFYDPSEMAGGVFSYPDFLTHMDRCARSIPALCGRLDRVAMDLDNPCLVEDERFDIGGHVQHRVLVDPRSIKEMSKAITDFHGSPIDMNRPLWEMLVISGINLKSLPKDCFLVALKVHHAVADGMTVMDMTAKMHGLTPVGNPVQLPSSNSLRQGLFGTATRILTGNFKQSVQLVSPLLQVAPKLSMKALNYSFERFGKPSSSAPKTRFSGDVSAERVWGYTVLPLAEFKRIRKLIPGVTINDLVLTVVAGGLREYLADKNELPESTLRAAAPISVRTEAERSEAGNQVGMLSVDLPVQIEDPLEQLMLISKSADQAKEAHEKLGGRAITDVIKYMPPAYMTYLGNMLGSSANKLLVQMLGDTVVTNVPGPSQEISLLGARLVNMSGAGPISHGCGLIHPVVSYNDKINIAVGSCPEMMPDVKFYTQCLFNSFARLQQSVQARYEGVLNAPKPEKSAAAKADRKPVSPSAANPASRKCAPTNKKSVARAPKVATVTTAKKSVATTVKKPAAKTDNKAAASTVKNTPAKQPASGMNTVQTTAAERTAEPAKTA
ncbi:MAG: wax ester/triacylglycerol synthase family O-acyltransferase [Motiliproteus sp.]